MHLKSFDVERIPTASNLWVKSWQQNGFYPISLYTKDKTHGGYHLISRSGNRTFYYDEERFMFFLKNNLSIISDKPLKNEREFNFE